METRFSVEAKKRLAPIMSADLETYVNGIGEMFREVEEYVREDTDGVYVGPITGPMNPATISGPELSWWAYHSVGTRVTKTWDTAVEIGGKPTVKVTRLVNDADQVGLAYLNLPVTAGQRYLWRGSFKGVPGDTYTAAFNVYPLINAGGSGTSFTSPPIVAKEGVTEFEFEITVPAGMKYAYTYILAPASKPVGYTFWVSSDTQVARRSTTTLPVGVWEKVLNPEAAINEAALMYLAQLAGVRVPEGLAFGGLQSFIERADARRRGRLDYMVELAQATLTGNKSVITLERADGNAWLLRVVTRTSETPDSNATREALLRGKPAGVTLDYASVAGITWDEAAVTWNATTHTWDESLSVIP